MPTSSLWGRRWCGRTGGPVLFLGGPRPDSDRAELLEEVRDVMDGGAAGMALGRAIYQDPEPASAAEAVAAIVHRS